MPFSKVSRASPMRAERLSTVRAGIAIASSAASRRIPACSLPTPASLKMAAATGALIARPRGSPPWDPVTTTHPASLWSNLRCRVDAVHLASLQREPVRRLDRRWRARAG